MKRVAWGLFWVYQVAGCIFAAYHWQEIVEYYHVVRMATEGILS